MRKRSDIENDAMQATTNYKLTLVIELLLDIRDKLDNIGGV
jgi:hypothetical protein